MIWHSDNQGSTVGGWKKEAKIMYSGRCNTRDHIRKFGYTLRGVPTQRRWYVVTLFDNLKFPKQVLWGILPLLSLMLSLYFLGK